MKGDGAKRDDVKRAARVVKRDLCGRAYFLGDAGVVGDQKALGNWTRTAVANGLAGDVDNRYDGAGRTA